MMKLLTFTLLLSMFSPTAIPTVPTLQDRSTYSQGVGVISESESTNQILNGFVQGRVFTSGGGAAVGMVDDTGSTWTAPVNGDNAGAGGSAFHKSWFLY